MNKRKNKYSIPVLLSCILILALMIVVTVYSFLFMQKVQSTVQTKEMKKQNTTGGFLKPEEAVRYYVEALLSGDEDQALRVSAVSGRSRGISVAEIINQEGAFSYDLTAPPSSTIGVYYPLGVSYWSDYYMKLYQNYESSLPNDSKKLKIKRIDYINPKEQSDTSNRLKVSDNKRLWGNSDQVDMMVLLQGDEKEYMMAFEVSSYDVIWYVSDTKNLSDNNVTTAIWQSSEEQYEQYIGDKKEIQALEELIIYDYDELEKKAENRKEEKNVEVLPVNYYLSNTVFGKDIDDVASKVSIAMRKNDSKLVMAYIKQNNDNDSSLEEKIASQENAAKGLMYFYYHLSNRELPVKETSLSELGMSGDNIVEWMNPDSLFYMEYGGIASSKEIDEHTTEAEVLLRYNGEFILTGWTFVHSKDGWQVESMDAKSIGYELGEIR